MSLRKPALLLCLMGWLCICGRAEAARFVPGDIYATAPFYNAVFQYDANGHYQSATFLPSDPDFGMAHGVTFGPDGLLYFVKQNYPNSTRGEVLALDASGQVQERYPFQAEMSSAATGDIAFDAHGHFYVGAVGAVLRFTIGLPDPPSVVWQPPSIVYGVDVLPSGNLLVGLEYGPQEFDPVTGSARQIAGAGFARGLGYDPANDSVLVSTFGTSATPDSIRRFDRASGALLDSVNVPNPIDVDVRPDGTIVVGTYGLAATLIDADLNVTGHLDSYSPGFVTIFIPEPAAVTVVLGACAAAVMSPRGRRERPELRWRG